MTPIKTVGILFSLYLILFPTTLYSYPSDYIYITEDTTVLYDSNRDRIIPIAIYHDNTYTYGKNVVILNHGYGENKGGDYKLYSHIAKRLAEEGYFVISIQHELATDDLLAMEGNLYKNRLPNWKRGVENILFTIGEFKKLKPELNWSNLSLIGHSNGGDMAMLFAQEYPEKINKAISLDNRRMPLPRTHSPHIYSLRGSDYSADEGVLPTQSEHDSLGIKVIYIDVIHTQMDDKASATESKIINDYLLEFLKEE